MVTSPKGVGVCREETDAVFELDEVIYYNGHEFKYAQINVKHINFGTDGNGNYKDKRRSDYTLEEIYEFLKCLDGIELPYEEDRGQTNETGRYNRYREMIDSPIEKNRDLPHLLVFDVYENFEDQITVITLFKKGNKR